MRRNCEQFNLEEVDCFTTKGGYETDVVHKINEGYKAWMALKSVLSKRIRYNSVSEEEIVPTALCEAETWCMRGAKSINVY